MVKFLRIFEIWTHLWVLLELAFLSVENKKVQPYDSKLHSDIKICPKCEWTHSNILHLLPSYKGMWEFIMQAAEKTGETRLKSW